MIKLINDVLADPGKYTNDYDPEQGYEIAGFGWFQGFNDIIARKATWYKATEDKPEFAHHTELLNSRLSPILQRSKAMGSIT